MYRYVGELSQNISDIGTALDGLNHKGLCKPDSRKIVKENILYRSFSAEQLYYISKCNTKLMAGVMIIEAKDAPPKIGKMRASNSRGLFIL